MQPQWNSLQPIGTPTFDWSSSVVTGERGRSLMMGSSQNHGVTRNESIGHQQAAYDGYNERSSQLATSPGKPSLSFGGTTTYPIMQNSSSPPYNSFTRPSNYQQQFPQFSSLGLSDAFGTSTIKKTNEQPFDGDRATTQSSYNYRNVSPPTPNAPNMSTSVSQKSTGFNLSHSSRPTSSAEGPKSNVGALNERKRPSDLLIPTVVHDRGLSEYTKTQFNTSSSSTRENRQLNSTRSSIPPLHPRSTAFDSYREDNPLNYRVSVSDGRRVSSGGHEKEALAIKRISSVVGSPSTNTYDFGNNNSQIAPQYGFHSSDYKDNIGGPKPVSRQPSSSAISTHNIHSPKDISCPFDTVSVHSRTISKTESITGGSGIDSSAIQLLNSPSPHNPNNRRDHQPNMLDMTNAQTSLVQNPNTDIIPKIVITPQRRGVSRTQSMGSTDSAFPNVGNVSMTTGSQFATSMKAQKEDDYIKREQRCLKTITELEHELRKKNNEVLQLRLALNRHCVSALTMAKFAAKSMTHPRPHETPQYDGKDSGFSTPRLHMSSAASLITSDLEVPAGGAAVAPPHVSGLPLAPIPYYRTSKDTPHIIGAGSGSLHSSSVSSSGKKVMCGSMWVLEETGVKSQKNKGMLKMKIKELELKKGQLGGKNTNKSLFSKIFSSKNANDTMSNEGDNKMKDIEEIDDQILKYKTELSNNSKWKLRYIVADDRGVTVYRDQSDFMCLSYHRAVFYCPYQTFELFVPRFSNQKNSLDDEDHLDEEGNRLPVKKIRDCVPMYHVEADDLLGIHFGFMALQPVGSKKSRPLNPPFLLRLTSTQEYEDWSHFFAMQFNRRLYRESFPMLYIGVMDGETVITVSEGTNTDHSLFEVLNSNTNEDEEGKELFCSSDSTQILHDEVEVERLKKVESLDLASCTKTLVLEDSKGTQTDEANERILEAEYLKRTEDQEEIINALKHIIQEQYEGLVSDNDDMVKEANDNNADNSTIISSPVTDNGNNISPLMNDINSECVTGEVLCNEEVKLSDGISSPKEERAAVLVNDLKDSIYTPQLQETAETVEENKSDISHIAMLQSIDKANKELEIATETLKALSAKQEEERIKRNSEERKTISVHPSHSQLNQLETGKRLQVGGPSTCNHKNTLKKNGMNSSPREPFLPTSSCLQNRDTLTNRANNLRNGNLQNSKPTKKSNVKITNEKYQSECDNCCDLREELDEVRHENVTLKKMLHKQQKTYEDKVRQLCDRAAHDMKVVMVAANKSILHAGGISGDRSNNGGLTHTSSKKSKKEHSVISGSPVIDAISLCIRRVFDKATYEPHHESSMDYPDSFDILCEMDPKSMALVSSNRIDTTYNLSNSVERNYDNTQPRQVRHGWAFRDLASDSNALIVVDVQCFPDGLDSRHLFAGGGRSSSGGNHVRSMDGYRSGHVHKCNGMTTSEPQCPPPKGAMRRQGSNSYTAGDVNGSSLKNTRFKEYKDEVFRATNSNYVTTNNGQSVPDNANYRRSSARSRSNETSVNLAPLSLSSLDMRRMLAIQSAIPARNNRSSLLRSDIGYAARFALEANTYPPPGVSAKPFMSPNSAKMSRDSSVSKERSTVMDSNESVSKTHSYVPYQQHEHPSDFTEAMRRVNNGYPNVNSINYVDNDEEERTEHDDNDVDADSSDLHRNAICDEKQRFEKSYNDSDQVTNYDVESFRKTSEDHQKPRGFWGAVRENKNKRAANTVPEIFELLRECSDEISFVNGTSNN